MYICSCFLLHDIFDTYIYCAYIYIHIYIHTYMQLVFCRRLAKPLGWINRQGADHGDFCLAPRHGRQGDTSLRCFTIEKP